MMQELIALFGFIVLLIMLAILSFKSVMTALSRKEKFTARISGATSNTQKNTDLADEQISLSKTISRSERIQLQAASIIGVDLQQADSYPVRWWLVPPIALAISWVIVFLATHPLGHAFLLYSFVWPVAWFGFTKALFSWFNNKRNAILLKQFPDALGTVVRCVRVGIPMGEALRTVALDSPEPTKAEFSILADKVAIGIPVDVALRELSLRIKLTEYQFFATAITLQLRAGGAITQTLETLSDVIRKRVALKARGYALTAEARTSSMLLAVLPFITATALFFIQRPYIVMLFYTKSGQSCLGLAILLMCMGMGTIQYMIISVLK